MSWFSMCSCGAVRIGPKKAAWRNHLDHIPPWFSTRIGGRGPAGVAGVAGELGDAGNGRAGVDEGEAAVLAGATMREHDRGRRAPLR